MVEFKNEVIGQIDFPEIKELDFQSIPQSYLKVMFIATGIFFAIIAIGMGAFFYFLPEPQSYLLQSTIGWAFLFLLTIFLKYIQFKKMGYIVREKDIIFRRGVVAIKSTIVPYNRVQHVMINEGVIMRLYGLASLKIFTAGGSKSDLSINGLKVENAMEIKDFITRDIKENPLQELEKNVLSRLKTIPNDSYPANTPENEI